MSLRILAVDDDALSLAAVQALLSSRGYQVDTAATGEEALARVRSAQSPYALVLLDYHLGTERGSDVAQALLQLSPDLYVLIHSGDTSREALKTTWGAGAVGFIDKDEDPESFLNTIRLWCNKYEETRKPVTLAGALGDYSDTIASIGLVGRSKAMADVVSRVKRYAPKGDHVLILGETGTGKERVAQALHQGPREKFFAVNCAAYSGNAELMESDLFGYVKGAFTGAVKDHVGVFEAAAGGTVFLDEIHALDRKAQQKLLRAIQERTVRPVGSTREYRVSVRLVAAAKPELELQASQGEFLPDLFERLNVLRIDVPPLRERPEDIEPLVAYFAAAYEKQTGEKRTFLYRTVKYLENYAWPRNVRELENTVRRLCIDTPTEKISPDHLDARFFDRGVAPQPSLKDRRDELMRTQVEEALANSSSQRDAARRLGLPESSLRRLMKKLGVGEKGTGGHP